MGMPIAESLTLRAQGFDSGARSLRSEFQPVTSFWEPLPRKWGIDFWGLVSLLGRQSRFRETLGNPQKSSCFLKVFANGC